MPYRHTILCQKVRSTKHHCHPHASEMLGHSFFSQDVHSNIARSMTSHMTAHLVTQLHSTHFLQTLQHQQSVLQTY
jgi:hypothetical protein